ncbi:MAG: hypothetical protein COA91_13525 [Robiginitomaculum sp.]|nr:MAG: hypothetical protein COA91_13525 [Robiginitomaculum sp.]
MTIAINYFIDLRAYVRAALTLIFMALLSPAAIFAQVANMPAEPQTIVLPIGYDFALDVGLSAVFLAEQDEQLTLEQVRATGQWTPVNLALIDGSRAMSGGGSAAPYAMGKPTWVYFKIRNDMDAVRKIVLDTQRPDLRNMVIYSLNGVGETNLILDYNDQLRFGQRQVKQAQLAVELYIAPKAEMRLYLRYERTASEPMALKVFGSDAYYNKIRIDAIWTAIFLAFLGTIVLITLLGLPALGWRVGLSYVFYVSIVGLWYAGVTGHFFSLVIPDFPVIASRAVETFALLVFVAFLNMGRVLFRFKNINATYDKILIFIITANLLSAALILGNDIYTTPWLAYTVSILTAISSVLYVISAVIAVRAKLDGSVVILIGSLSLFVAFAVYRYITIAVNAGDLAVPIGRAILIPPISLIEISCFALAMIQAQIGIRKQRDQAKRAEFQAVQEQLRLNTALRSSEKSYQKARQQAVRRRERLSLVSHDILQPLISLRSMLGEIKQKDSAKAQDMQNAFDYLETLARDSLVATTSDGGNIPKTQCETFNLTAVTDNVFAMFREEAKDKGLDFEYQACDLQVFSNPVELMRILNNLVSNAIKHTNSGGVKLTCRAQDGVTHITVEDTGAGMSATQIKAYLKARQKSEASGGTGLGLYQVKTACETLGHKFKINSSPEKGTTASVLI